MNPWSRKHEFAISAAKMIGFGAIMLIVSLLTAEKSIRNEADVFSSKISSGYRIIVEGVEVEEISNPARYVVGNYDILYDDVSKIAILSHK